MRSKAERYRRNRKIRASFKYDVLDLQNMTEEEKDTLFNSIPSKTNDCICSFSLDEPVNYAKRVGVKKPLLFSEENNMNTTTTNAFESERRALRDLLRSLEREKASVLRKVHHIDAYRPSTYGELRKLIADRKVTLHPEYDDYKDDEAIPEYVSPLTMIALNYAKPDIKAYKEGCEKVEKETTRLSTQIAVLNPEETLKKLEAFESKTIH